MTLRCEPAVVAAMVRTGAFTKETRSDPDASPTSPVAKISAYLQANTPTCPC
jgi:hypothetical protein